EGRAPAPGRSRIAACPDHAGWRGRGERRRAGRLGRARLLGRLGGRASTRPESAPGAERQGARCPLRGRVGRGPAAVVERHAAAARGGEAPDPVAGAVWGLVRTAQTENPGGILLADVDGTEHSRDALVGALATGEPQLALREGAAYAPRVTPAVGGASLVPPP